MLVEQGFLVDMYRNIQTFTFKMLQECSSLHCVKSVKIRSYSGPYFPVFKYREMRSRTLYLGTFYAVWESRNGALQMFFLAPNKNMFAQKFIKLFERNCIVK